MTERLNWTEWSLWRRQWHPTPVFLPGKSHGRRSLVGCHLWSHKEWNTTERLHFHFSLSCIGEGNGNPLQCSCLENPRDGGAWWAAVYGVTQSWTRLKRLSSSNDPYLSHFIDQDSEFTKSLPIKRKEKWKRRRKKESSRYSRLCLFCLPSLTSPDTGPHPRFLLLGLK